mmetsp:Transcript_18790/g.29867  ORF Transcript_18790/g.29867 Transcript_18790/m.29867 type:complete len:89 (-) Transcript_18790:546-812(-)
MTVTIFNTPKDPTTRRQPMLACQGHAPFFAQLFEGINAHAISDTRNPPKDQKTDSATSNRPRAKRGVNSANIAPSTGKLPPTPVPRVK